MAARNLDFSDASLAKSWCDFHIMFEHIPIEEQTALYDADPDWWAVDAFMDLQFENPVRALEIVFLIARESSHEWILEILGAGPLEGLLADDPTFLAAVELEAKSSPGLVEALKSVWQNAMPDETWDAVQRLAKLS